MTKKNQQTFLNPVSTTCHSAPQSKNAEHSLSPWKIPEKSADGQYSSITKHAKGISIYYIKHMYIQTVTKQKKNTIRKSYF